MIRTTRTLGSLVLLVSLASAQNHKLNGPLARALVGRFELPQTSADGRYHLYNADRDGDGDLETYSLPTGGSKDGPLQLIDGASAFIAPDGKHALYSADVDENGSLDLVVVPIDGSAAPRRLSAALSGADASVQASAVDTLHVLYVAGSDSALYSVPLDGSAAPVRLNGNMVLGGPAYSNIELAQDGLTTLFAVSPGPDAGLYVVPTDGSQPAHRLPIPLVSGGAVVDFAFGADATQVFYVADQEEDERYELFSIASDGSEAPRKLSGALVPGGDVGLPYDGTFYPGGFQLTLDGRWLLYSADQDEDELFQLYSVPTDGSRAPIALSTSIPPEGGFYASYDSAWALYYGDPNHTDFYELVSVPIDGSALARPLTGPIFPGDHRFIYQQLSPDSRTVVYAADQDVVGRYELYSAPIDGHAPAVKLNAPFPPGGELSVNFRFLLPGFYVIEGGVVYAGDQEIDGLEELYFVPAEGGTAPRKLATGPFEDWLPSYSNFYSGYDHFYHVPDDFGSVLILRHDKLESIAALDPAAQPIVLDQLQPGPISGRVDDFELSSAGDRVVYRAQEQNDLGAEFYSVRTDKPQEKVQPLPDPRVVLEQRLTPDGSRLLYRARLSTPGPVQLFSVPTAGGPSTLLSGPDSTSPGFEFTPDGQRVLYSSISRLELFVVPVDGSVQPLRIASALESTITAQRISADGSRAALLLENDHLVAVALDGSAPAVRVSATGHRAQPDFQITPDGSRVVYRTNPWGHSEVFVGPSDASSVPVRISAAMPVFADVQSLALSPDGSRVVYLADVASNERFELFSVPIEGGVPPLRLHAPLAGERDVLDYRISADSQRVVFRGDLVVDQRVELFSAPLDASAPPARINGSLVAGGGVLSFDLSPDGQRVIYLATQEASDVIALYSAPIRGGRGTVRLSRALVPGGDVRAFQISADSSAVAFTAQRNAAGALTLLAAPITGAVKAHELAGPFTGGGSVASFALSADGSVAAYRADQEAPHMTEVFAAATHPRPVVVKH